MKIDHLLNEHKKGVKAIKYSKKPKPLVGPEALKASEKKADPKKTELQTHKNLSAKKPAPKKVSPIGESKPKGYDSDGNPLGGGYDEYDNDKKTWTVVVNGKAWKTFDNERQAYKAADAIERKYGKKTRVVSESKGIADKIVAAGAATRKSLDAAMKSIPRPFDEKEVANDLQQGQAAQSVAKKVPEAFKMPPESAQEKLYKKHQELRKKSGLPDPKEYKKNIEKKQKEIDDMKEAKQPEAPKPRNFVAKNAKTVGAGKHKDAKKAANTVRGQKHKNKEIAEAEMGKIIDYKPGQTATLNTGPGMTTILDLKKNPTSLTKDPATGKLKLVGPQAQGAPAQQSTQQSTIKAGDQVEIGKTTEDLLRLAGLK